MEPAPQEKNKTYFIFVAALLVRLAALLFFRPGTIGGDEYNYWRLARQVLGGTYAETFFLPLWPHLMAAVLLIWDQVFALRLFCVFLGALNVALVHRLGLRVLDARTAFVAAVVYALYPDHAMYSNFIYAEIPLETFILFGVLVFFGRWPLMPGMGRSLAAFFILGVGTLCKHFTVIAWAAIMVGIFFAPSPRRFRLAFASLVYFIPAIVFSVWAGARAGDPFALINTPIKSAMESHTQQAGGAFSLEDRSEQLNSALSKISGQSPFRILSTLGSNLSNLWTPNSYVSGRLRGNYYERRGFIAGAYIIAVCQFLLLSVGLVGLICAPKGMFRTYSAWSILLLSGMCALWFMVSRYRVPVLHVFALWGAFALVHRTYLSKALKEPGRLAWSVLSVCLLAAIYVVRWHTVGYWP